MNVPPARASRLRERLLAWWDAGHRALPWRAPPGAADPYRVWISEAMLQQTQVAAVAPYYARFLARFPSLAALAEAPEADVLAAWSGLGYYARARNLHRAAREALARHGGLPATVAELRALPGFGPYTAGAVASIAFGAPAAAVDGNVARVLSRLFCVDGEPSAAATRGAISHLADALLHPGRAGEWNQALMDLGATVCVKPVPRCAACPLSSSCEARRQGRERELPLARKRAAARSLTLACAIVRERGRVLLVERPAAGLFGGLWAPPSVELGARGAPDRALARTLAAEGLEVQVGGELAAVRRTLTHRRLTLLAYEASLLAGPPARLRFQWAKVRGMERLAVPTAMRRLLDACSSREAP